MNPRLGTCPGAIAFGSLCQHAGLVAPDTEYRMNQAMNRQPVPVAQHGDRIDEERHVVGHNIDNGVRRVPAMPVEVRRIESDDRLSGLARRAQMVMLYRRAIERIRVEFTLIGQVGVGKIEGQMFGQLI